MVYCANSLTSTTLRDMSVLCSARHLHHRVTWLLMLGAAMPKFFELVHAIALLIFLIYHNTILFYCA